MIDEVMESPGFWILAGGGVLAELIGWIISRSAFEHAFPFWQVLIVMFGTVVAAGFFALKS